MRSSRQGGARAYTPRPRTIPSCFFKRTREALAIEGHFHTDDLKENLRRRSVHGAAFTGTSLAVKALLNMGSTMILARLLTPEDFGLVAMVVSVTGLVTIFRDLGLATATVQSATLDHTRVNALYWVNVLFGLVMGALTALSAPLFAWFFREPRLTAVGAVLGGVMFIEGLSIQHQALLRRRMRFDRLAASEIGALAVGVIVAVILAWRGAGYWSLVWMRVASAAAGVVSLWLLCDWRPERNDSIRRSEGAGPFRRSDHDGPLHSLRVTKRGSALDRTIPGIASARALREGVGMARRSVSAARLARVSGRRPGLEPAARRPASIPFVLLRRTLHSCDVRRSDHRLPLRRCAHA